jgi:hypothetical protein
VKKFVSVLLAFFYLATSSGMQVQWHYCGGKVSSVSLNAPKPKCCCGKKAKKRCCANSQIKYHTDKHKQRSYASEIRDTAPVAVMVFHAIALNDLRTGVNYVTKPFRYPPGYKSGKNLRC